MKFCNPPVRIFMNAIKFFSRSLSLRERAGVRACSKSNVSEISTPPHPNPLPMGEGIRIAIIIAIFSSFVFAQEPTTKPIDYSGETYRLVNERDEIVSVLNNNLTVIVKRVSSPVVAVRAYAQTGGVYEGKWLG